MEELSTLQNIKQKDELCALALFSISFVLWRRSAGKQYDLNNEMPLLLLGENKTES